MSRHRHEFRGYGIAGFRCKEPSCPTWSAPVGKLTAVAAEQEKIAAARREVDLDAMDGVIDQPFSTGKIGPRGARQAAARAGRKAEGGNRRLRDHL